MREELLDCPQSKIFPAVYIFLLAVINVNSVYLMTARLQSTDRVSPITVQSA